MSTKPVILTGIRSNQEPTIGNYFGAILPLIDLANTKSGEYDVNIFVPDLHSFTTPIDHSKLYEQTMHNIKLFVAAGLPLDNPSVHVYRQSYIPAHSELAWILDNFTGMGEMTRMTQFKDKARAIQASNTVVDELRKAGLDEQMYKKLFAMVKLALYSEESSRQSISVGLFNYPVLMAADILIYGATYVPVGDDQTQHLEFARDIGERLNNRFGELFTIPKSVKEQHAFFGKDQGLRIMDLQDPTKKMSKSDETGRGVIFLSDDPTVAAKKIMSAATDSLGSIRYDRQNQPGITNLLDILALLRGQDVAITAKEFEGQERYGDFKKVVAEAMQAFLTDFQARLQQVDDAQLYAKLANDEAVKNVEANETLHRVQKAVGLRI